jgi:hypothetical protein
MIYGYPSIVNLWLRACGEELSATIFATRQGAFPLSRLIHNIESYEQSVFDLFRFQLYMYS